MEIRRVDPRDDALLRRCWEVEQAANRADRPDALLRTWEAMRVETRDTSEALEHVLAAVVDGETVGVATLSCPLLENQHAGFLEVAVAPSHRRRGIGGALTETASSMLVEAGRTTVLAEVYAVPGSETAGIAFASAAGFTTVHREDHLVLDLPATPPEPAAGADHDLLTWRGRCPEEWLASYVVMQHRMAADVPLGETDWREPVLDAARLRVWEARTLRAYDLVTAAARAADGGLVGYSRLLVPHGDPAVVQDDTLVMPAHRGHRLGLRLKGATLRLLQRDFPASRTVHTFTDPDNLPMYRTNLAFGFRPAEELHEVQRRVGRR